MTFITTKDCRSRRNLTTKLAEKQSRSYVHLNYCTPADTGLSQRSTFTDEWMCKRWKLPSMVILVFPLKASKRDEQTTNLSSVKFGSFVCHQMSTSVLAEYCDMIRNPRFHFNLTVSYYVCLMSPILVTFLSGIKQVPTWKIVHVLTFPQSVRQVTICSAQFDHIKRTAISVHFKHVSKSISALFLLFLSLKPTYRQGHGTSKCFSAHCLAKLVCNHFRHFSKTEVALVFVSRLHRVFRQTKPKNKLSTRTLHAAVVK